MPWHVPDPPRYWVVGDPAAAHLDLGIAPDGHQGQRLYGPDGVTVLVDLDAQAGTATLTKVIVQTAATGARLVLTEQNGYGQLIGYTGVTGETFPGGLGVSPNYAGTHPQTTLSSPGLGANGDTAAVQLVAQDTRDPQSVQQAMAVLKAAANSAGNHGATVVAQAGPTSSVALTADQLTVSTAWSLRVGWTACAMSNGWAGQTGHLLQACRDAAGNCHLRGHLTPGTISGTGATTMGTLPAAVPAPVSFYGFAATLPGADASVARITIQPDGTIVFHGTALPAGATSVHVDQGHWRAD